MESKFIQFIIARSSALTIFISLLLTFYISPAQNITRAEYFFDSDPGFGSAINVPVTPAPNLSNLSFTIDLATVSPGFHTFFARVKDEYSRWSLCEYKAFYKGAVAYPEILSNINKAEYFFDSDPGFGSGIDIPVTPMTDLSNISFFIDLNSVQDGFHTLYYRVRNEYGRWSSCEYKAFYKGVVDLPYALPEITKLEYFFDTDPGYGMGTDIPVTPSVNIVNQSFILDFTGLPLGSHTLWIRAKDADGKWSQLVYESFTQNYAPVSVTLSGATAICGGDSAVITASVTNGWANPFYQWYINGEPANPGSCSESLSDGLVAYYPFNGNAGDSTENNHDGTLFGGPSTATDRFNQPGKAYSFDGTDDYIDLGNWFTCNKFSISFWMNQSGITGNYTDIIDNNHTDYQNWVIQSSPGSLDYGFGVAYCGGAYFNINLNHWRHVVCIKDSLTIKIYVDGVLKNSASSSYLPHYVNQNLYISRWGGGGRYFKGLLDDVRFYNRALCPTEVVKLYQVNDSILKYIPQEGDEIYCVVTTPYGCSGTSDTLTISIVPSPSPSLSGPVEACRNSTGNVYATDPGMTSYIWTVSQGGVITSGEGTEEIEVTWSATGMKTVTVNYMNASGCSAPSPSVFHTTIHELPVPSISGPATICSGEPGILYTTDSGMTDYQWNVPAGGEITGGQGTEAITVLWNMTGDQWVEVSYQGLNCPSEVKHFPVIVSPGTVPGIVIGEGSILFGMETTLELQGSVGTVLRWQKQLNGEGWTDIQETGTVYAEIPDTTGTWEYRAEVKSGSCSAFFSIPATLMVIPVIRTVNLKLFLEGLYDPVSGMMNKAQGEYGEMYPGTVADKITVKAARPYSPYTVCYVANEVDLDQDGNCTFTVPRTGSYYLFIRHRNSIETWSAFPVDAIPDPVYFDFTTAASQAFGDNMRDMGGVYAIWGGDVNQDGIVDAGDMNPVDNASTAITFGYVNEDVNGDGIVDAGDMNIVDNNSTAIIFVITP